MKTVTLCHKVCFIAPAIFLFFNTPATQLLCADEPVLYQNISVTGNGFFLLTEEEAEQWLFHGSEVTRRPYAYRNEDRRSAFDYSTSMSIYFDANSRWLNSATFAVEWRNRFSGPPFYSTGTSPIRLSQYLYAFDYQQESWRLIDSDNHNYPNYPAPTSLASSVTLEGLGPEFVSSDGDYSMRYSLYTHDYSPSSASDRNLWIYAPTVLSVAPSFFTQVQDLQLVNATGRAIGDTGLISPFLDPLDSEDRKAPGEIPFFGMNVETELGWESSADWDETGDPDLVEKTYVNGEQLQGQWSRIGQEEGQARLFGNELYGGDWRLRELDTLSTGSFSLSGLAGLTELNVSLDYETQIDGLALKDSTAAVLNLAVHAGLGLSFESVGRVARFVGEQVVGNLTETSVDFFPVESQFVASSEIGVQFFQNGLPISDVIDLSVNDGESSGIVDGRRYRLGRNATITADPQHDVELRLHSNTTSEALGWAQSFVGIRNYKVGVDVKGVADVPIMFSGQDPVPEGNSAFLHELLLASINTPELTVGTVSTVTSFGSYTPDIGEEFIVLSTVGGPSGIVLPVALADRDEQLTLSLVAGLLDYGLADKFALQVVYVHEDQVFEVLDVMGDSFSYDSEIPTSPFESLISPFNVDISSLPRGQGNFFISLGDLGDVASMVDIAVHSVSIGAVPEPSSVVMVLVGGILLGYSRVDVRGSRA